MAKSRELFAMKIVEELPTRGDNYHLYLLSDGAAEPKYTAYYYINGEWKQVHFL